MASSHRSSAVRPALRPRRGRSGGATESAFASSTVIRLPADVHQALRVAHHERPQRQPELLAVRQGQVVRARDPHGAGLGVEARREGAQRVDPAADAVLRLEHDDVVALPLQLVRGHQAGEPGTDDHHPLRRLVCWARARVRGRPARRRAAAGSCRAVAAGSGREGPAADRSWRLILRRRLIGPVHGIVGE